MLELGKMQMDLKEAESVRFSGRCVAALAADDQAIERSGEIYTVKALASHCGYIDPDHE